MTQQIDRIEQSTSRLFNDIDSRSSDLLYVTAQVETEVQEVFNNAEEALYSNDREAGETEEEGVYNNERMEDETEHPEVYNNESQAESSSAHPVSELSGDTLTSKVNVEMEKGTVSVLRLAAHSLTEVFDYKQQLHMPTWKEATHSVTVTAHEGRVFVLRNTRQVLQRAMDYLNKEIDPQAATHIVNTAEAAVINGTHTAIDSVVGTADVGLAEVGAAVEQVESAVVMELGSGAMGWLKGRKMSGAQVAKFAVTEVIAVGAHTLEAAVVCAAGGALSATVVHAAAMAVPVVVAAVAGQGAKWACTKIDKICHTGEAAKLQRSQSDPTATHTH